MGIDFTKDGHRDLIARDSSGELRLFEGDGAGGFSADIRLGPGWQGLTDITPVGDFNGDGNADVIALDSSGRLWLYPGNGSDGFGARTLIATGWESMTAIQSVGRRRRRRPHRPDRARRPRQSLAVSGQRLRAVSTRACSWRRAGRR